MSLQNDFSLDNLPVGQNAEVKELNLTGSMRRRILDFGLVPGTLIQCTQQSPVGSLRAYCIRGSVVAIRPEDAQHIILKSESDNF